MFALEFAPKFKKRVKKVWFKLFGLEGGIENWILLGLPTETTQSSATAGFQLSGVIPCKA